MVEGKLPDIGQSLNALFLPISNRTQFESSSSLDYSARIGIGIGIAVVVVLIVSGPHAVLIDIRRCWLG